MAEKYLVQVGYVCAEASKAVQPQWFEIDKKPGLGITEDALYREAMPISNCPMYSEGDERQSCEDDPDCCRRAIIKVDPYSAKEAKKRGARRIERRDTREKQSGLVDSLEEAA